MSIQRLAAALGARLRTFDGYKIAIEFPTGEILASNNIREFYKIIWGEYRCMVKEAK